MLRKRRTPFHASAESVRILQGSVVQHRIMTNENTHKKRCTVHCKKFNKALLITQFSENLGNQSMKQLRAKRDMFLRKWSTLTICVIKRKNATKN